MPHCVMRQANHWKVHSFGHLRTLLANAAAWEHGSPGTHLAEALRFCVFLKAKSWEMNAWPEDLRFWQDTNTTNTIYFHLHVGVAVGVP